MYSFVYLISLYIVVSIIFSNFIPLSIFLLLYFCEGFQPGRIYKHWYILHNLMLMKYKNRELSLMHIHNNITVYINLEYIKPG